MASFQHRTQNTTEAQSCESTCYPETSRVRSRFVIRPLFTWAYFCLSSFDIMVKAEEVPTSQLYPFPNKHTHTTLLCLNLQSHILPWASWLVPTSAGSVVSTDVCFWSCNKNLTPTRHFLHFCKPHVATPETNKLWSEKMERIQGNISPVNNLSKPNIHWQNS